MLNKVILFTLIYSIPFFCYCQAKDSSTTQNIEPKIKRAYLGLSYGFSIPMGSFSSEGSSLENSAFARDGQNFHLFDFGYLINESFSIKSFYISASNSINENLLAEAINKTYDRNVTVNTSSYELKAVLVGFGITKMNTLTDFDLHFLLGYGESFLPAITLSEFDSTTFEVKDILFKPSSSNGFGVGLSAALRIHLNSSIDFTTQMSYIIFERVFEQIRVENNTSSVAQSKIGYEILTINFGLAYRFNFEDNN